MVRKKKRKVPKKKTNPATVHSAEWASNVYGKLSLEDQLKLDELCRHTIAFRLTLGEFDALIRKEMGVNRDAARARLSALRSVERAPRNRKDEKEAQQDRLMSDIKKATDANRWSDVAKLESLYADITGTKEPLQVEHVLQGTIATVISQITPDQYAQIVTEQRRRLELAEAAEKAHLLPEAEIVKAG